MGVIADNSVQTGNDSIATDELSTLNDAPTADVKAQRVKVGYGSDGSLRDVDAEYPLPTIDTESQVLLRRLADLLGFARDASDRLRVVSDTASTMLAYNYAAYWGNANTYPLWYGTGAPGSIDAREPLSLQSRQAFQVIRNRWTVS